MSNATDETACQLVAELCVISAGAQFVEMILPPMGRFFRELRSRSSSRLPYQYDLIGTRHQLIPFTAFERYCSVLPTQRPLLEIKDR